MGIRWTTSAAKHRIAQDDALHAMLHAAHRVPRFEPSRVAGLEDPDLFIGPSRTGQMLEVMASVDQAAGVLWVFHVMPLRSKILARALEAQK